MLRRIKNTLIYHLARTAIAVVGLAPAPLVAFLGRLLGAIAFFVARRERERAGRQLELALGPRLTPRRRRLVIRGIFRELGTSAVELCRMLRLGETPPEVHVTEESLAALDEALVRGVGVIFVTGHIGNWELMAARLAELGYPISTVAKESYDPRFTRLIDRFRADLGVRAIYRGQPGAAAAMLRALRGGRILGFLIDQDTSVPSAFVPFFGRPAHTPIGAAVFAARSGAPVVLGTIRRTTGRRHVVEITPCPRRDGWSEAQATAAFTREIEARIRRHPSQWVWFHERWKTRPEDEAAA